VYTLTPANTDAEGCNHMRGPRPVGINWAVWLWAGMVLMTLFQVGAMFGGVAQTLNLIWPAIPIRSSELGPASGGDQLGSLAVGGHGLDDAVSGRRHVRRSRSDAEPDLASHPH